MSTPVAEKNEVGKSIYELRIQSLKTKLNQILDLLENKGVDYSVRRQYEIAVDGLIIKLNLFIEKNSFGDAFLLTNNILSCMDSHLSYLHSAFGSEDVLAKHQASSAFFNAIINCHIWISLEQVKKN